VTEPRPANSLLTPAVAFAGTLAGVFALFAVNVELAPLLSGGPWAICPAPECALGAGIWLIFGGFAVLCVSVFVSVIVALRHRDTNRRAAAVRGGWIVLVCLAAYVVESVVLWILV
jgi:hypothetical protein